MPGNYNKQYKFINRFFFLMLLAYISAIILFKIGYLPLKVLIWMAVGIEPVLLILVVVNFNRIRNQYNNLLEVGLTGFDAAQKALETLLPHLAAKLALAEPRLYYSLYRSFKKETPPDGEFIFATRRDNYNIFLKAIAVLIITEAAAVALFMPAEWQVFKVVHAILSMYALLFILASYRSTGLYQHVVSDKILKLQFGLACRGCLNWSDIQSINSCSREVPGFSMGPSMPKNEQGNLYISTGEKCNIEINLVKPHCFSGLIKDFKKVNKIFLSLDRPQLFLDHIQELLN